MICPGTIGVMQYSNGIRSRNTENRLGPRYPINCTTTCTTRSSTRLQDQIPHWKNYQDQCPTGIRTRTRSQDQEKQKVQLYIDAHLQETQQKKPMPYWVFQFGTCNRTRCPPIGINSNLRQADRLLIVQSAQSICLLRRVRKKPGHKNRQNSKQTINRKQRRHNFVHNLSCSHHVEEKETLF